MKKIFALALVATVVGAMLAGCGAKEEAPAAPAGGAAAPAPEGGK